MMDFEKGFERTTKIEGEKKSDMSIFYHILYIVMATILIPLK